MSRFDRELPFKTMYDPVPRVLTVNNEPSLTDQSQKASTEISNIIATYDKTGVLSHVNTHKPMYDDVSDISDYHDAMNRVTSVKQTFEGLPSKLRRKFGNDPEQFVQFMADPENLEEAVELGLWSSEILEPAPEPVPETETETASEPAPEPEKTAS